jgi:hypothetical protein
MCLTPRDGNLAQGYITIPIPIFSNAVCMNPVFEVTKRASPTYGVTQIIPYVLILYREAETLHNTILINLEAVRQLEIMIRFYNALSHTNHVMLPIREVFEGFVILSSTKFLVGDGDHFSSGQVEKGGLFIGLEFQSLDNVRQFYP